jgi:uncharacterized surface protein with fasciclin (FAS1) repeats
MKRTTLHSLTAAVFSATLFAMTPQLAMSGMGYGASQGSAQGEKTVSRADIVDTAIGAGQFNTLAKALTAAGLVETLKGAGPFTVFAPTDAAFAKIPADKLNALLADKAALTKVLTYHVVPGRIMAKDVKSGEVKTVQGQPLTIKAGKSGVMVNDARVVKTDVVASNGVIHVIDTVILPN